MSKFSVSGLNELSDEFDRISKEVSNFDGKELSAEELFDDSGFVEKYTGFKTINGFMSQFGSDLSNDELFQKSSKSEFNRFVAKSTGGAFKTFQAFYDEAISQYLENMDL